MVSTPDCLYVRLPDIGKVITWIRGYYTLFFAFGKPYFQDATLFVASESGRVGRGLLLCFRFETGNFFSQHGADAVAD